MKNKRKQNKKFSLNIKEIKKDVHGSMSMMTSKKITVVAWKDNKVVTMASNAYGINVPHCVTFFGKLQDPSTKVFSNWFNFKY